VNIDERTRRKNLFLEFEDFISSSSMSREFPERAVGDEDQVGRAIDGCYVYVAATGGYLKQQRYKVYR